MRVPMMPMVLNFPRFYGSVHFGDAIQNGQRRYREQLADAEVTAHRGDGSNLRAGCLEPRDQSRKNSGLPSRILVSKLLREDADLGVRDRQVQTRSGLRVAVGQAAVVELGRGRSNAADQSDMHLCIPFPPRRAQPLGRLPQWSLPNRLAGEQITMPRALRV